MAMVSVARLALSRRTGIKRGHPGAVSDSSRLSAGILIRRTSRLERAGRPPLW